MRYQDIPVEQLSTLGPHVRRIDVREPHEYTGPLGHLPDAELVPLGTLARASAGWDPAAPLLLVCRSGGRSGQAAQQLAAQGFTHLYNLAGGMLAVERAGLRVEGRSAPGAAQPA